MGSPVESTNDTQSIQTIRVYPGADGSFTLYTDDGTTYAYEKDVYSATVMTWNDAQRKLTQAGTGEPPPSVPVEIVGSSAE